MGAAGLTPWASGFAVDWAIIASAMAAAAALGPLAWWPAALVIGARMHALGELGHTASHRLVTGRRGDDWLARVAFAPLGIDLAKYRPFHLAHHRHLGTADDPEVALQAAYPQRWTAYRVRDSVADALGLTVGESVGVLRKMWTVRSALVWLALLLSAGLVLGWAVAALWLLASGTGLPLAHRLRAWTEHRHLTRPGLTILKPRPALWRRAWYLPHGTWLHAEHHGGPVLT